MKPITKIIFGLGNPGPKYKNNRHNIGQMVVDELGKAGEARFKRNLFLAAHVLNIKVRNEGVLLVKPNTFMNNSGVCVKKALNKHKVKQDNVLIVYDDIDLPLGAIRMKKQGSFGGHRGLASIIERLGGDRITRLKIGVGRPDAGEDVAEYVLSDFSRAEESMRNEVLSRAVEACIDWASYGADYVMKEYNKNM